MNTGATSARDEILAEIGASIGGDRTVQAPPLPPSARVPPRTAGATNDEMLMLLDEVAKLGGKTRRLGVADLNAALAELVTAEEVKKVALWQTLEFEQLGLEPMLAAMGVEIVSPRAGKELLAECDLGITGADFTLPETGTLTLITSPQRPRMVSLLPRVHLALVRSSSLRADLPQVFAEMPRVARFVLVTGPSRTADIEMTVTVGVHGPQALHVWALE